MRKAFLIGAALLAFSSAPAFAQSSTPSFDLTSLEQTLTADLQAADADAKAHGDTIASQCYEGVIAYQAANPVVLPGSPVGVASGFQAARDVVKAGESAASTGIPPALVTTCGPLALDVQNDLGKASSLTIFGIKF